MNDKIKFTLASVVAVGVVGISIHDYVKVHRVEKAKREAIHHNLLLNLMAINNSEKRIHDKIANGEYDDLDLNRLFKDMNAEIEFQKIIVHED